MAQDDKQSPSEATQAADVLPRIPVVGLGASAGGIKALQKFFELLPASIGAAFVVIVHLDPEHRSELPEILASRSRMPVKQVTGTSPLNRDCIYVIPPDRQLRISDDEISAVPFEEPRGQRAPIDHFFRSLAEQHGDGFAIILSGAGCDGTQGVKAVKAAGGIVLVQDPEEAEYPSMPRSAIATEMADFVLPISALVTSLIDLMKTKQQLVLAQQGDDDEQLRRVLAHLRVRTGHDFSHYKRSTVMRRVLRRMQVARRESIEDYFVFLRENADESQELLADLLISVTTFFRDPKAFEALAKHAIANVVNKPPGQMVRIWVAGCATGEEAYSIAILLLEEAARHELRPEMQILASDLDTKALAIAREGCYPATIEVDVSEERLRRFFTRDGDQYRVKREIRDIVLFANHSLLKDPPFSRLDIISCRNVLIYLDRELQSQVLATLHYGLNPNGFLLLGSSESAEHPDGLFRTIDRDMRLYQSTGRSSQHMLALPRLSGLPLSMDPAYRPIAPPKSSGALEAHRDALERAAPPSILVDDRHRVLHISETAGRYLLPSAGPLSTDVIDLVRPELRFELRTALHRALERNEASLSEPIMVGFNGSARRILLQVKNVADSDQDKGRRAIILFVEGEHRPAAAAVAAPEGEGVVQRLEQQLRVMQGQLRTTREESEAANEELRAANEELQSVNEEYRSTAEELETSKEELQSINEELQTVNSELKLKLETVSRANSDLQNLMAATDFATLFVDAGLRIKRFTPKLTELFSITLNDVGRPITDFAHKLNYDGFSEDAKLVLKNLMPVEREIRGREGGWFHVRFRPYRTVDDKIDGVVATFLDVTDRRQMEDALRHSGEMLRQESRLVELSRAPIFVWDSNGTIVQWNRGSEELYGYSRAEAIGKEKQTLLKTTVPGSTLQTVKDALFQDGTWRGELHQKTKDGRNLIVESHIELVSEGDPRFVLESTRDITASKALEERQRLLLRELAHRVKNTLAVVQSMVHQTWRAAPGKDDFIQRLDGRIVTLARSHDLLLQSEWRGAELHGLVEHQMGAYLSEEPPRVRVDGVPVTLPPDLAMPFGMVLHELTTNAAKYGSLSGNKGEVHLNWEISGNKPCVLKVIWEELSGPPVKKPTHKGVGTKLIKSGIPGSTVEQEYSTTGFRCTIQVPLGGEDLG
jgi:two-component system CheB/CheR fusion protein